MNQHPPRLETPCFSNFQMANYEDGNPEKSTKQQRLVVLTNGNYFARIILNDLFKEFQIHRVVLISGDYKGRTGFSALRWLLPVTAFPYLLFKISLMIAFLVAKRIWRRSHFDVESLAKSRGIPVCKFHSIREEAAIRCVEASGADLIVSVSCPQLIGDRVLQAARRGGINIHSSLLPQYAGLAPYYWVLVDGEKVTGTTVHYMTEKFDEGNILGRTEIAIKPGDSAFSLFRSLAQAGSPLLVSSSHRALAGDEGTPQSKEFSSYRSHPDYASYQKLRKNGHFLLRISEFFKALRKYS
jgi:folate-dependent phosphoribosylglycinamide formyltransferase PurN